MGADDRLETCSFLTPDVRDWVTLLSGRAVSLALNPQQQLYSNTRPHLAHLTA